LSGLRAASVLFFLSGATALVYEVIWFKRFAHVLGSSSLAIAVVVASFLGGLALGAFLAGRLADRVRRPLLWYGVAEIAIAVLVLVVPHETAWLRRWDASLYPLLGQTPLFYAAIQALLVFLVLGPPTALMGATLPLLVRRFDRVGWLYGINTAGAACGCYVAAFHLLPAAGLAGANLATACVNLAVGAVAILVARSLPALTPRDEAVAPAPRAILLAAALAGCAALILQIVWNRQLALMLGGSVYAFAAVLFMVLLGIGCGGILFQLRAPRRLGWVILLLLVTTVLGKLAVEPLTRLVGEVRRLRLHAGFNVLVCLTAGGVLQFLPSLLMGVLFPALVVRARGRVGGVYAANTVGAVAGVLGATALLVPAWGTAGALACALGLYLLVLLAVEPRTPPVLAGLVLLLPAAWPGDPRVTDVGMFLHGPQTAEGGYRLVFFQEGGRHNVLVRESPTGARTLHVNGKPDASSAADMSTQLGLAYFPRFLRPAGADVLVIGFGSGTTAGASLRFPGTHVTCCEIEPEVYRAGRHFADVNHRPQDSPRFRIVLNDGRHHLQGDAKRYDLIISEPSNPWLAGMSNLFTQEFYRTVRSRLKPRGLLAQWVQTYALSPAEYALVARTVASVFAHVALVRVADGDTILVAADEPLLPGAGEIAAAQTLAAHCADDLERYFAGRDVRALLLEHVVLVDTGLHELIGPAAVGGVNTDQNLRLEFEAPRRLFRRDGGAEVERWLLGAVDGAWQRQALDRWGTAPPQLAGVRRLVELLLARGRVPAARSLTAAVLERAPDAAWFRATRLVHRRFANTFVFRKELTALARLAVAEALRVGVELAEADDHLRAVEVFRVLARLHPDSAEIWARLAVSERAAGDRGSADEALARAVELDPFNALVRSVRAQWD
jgi:spermidine synthase